MKRTPSTLRALDDLDLPVDADPMETLVPETDYEAGFDRWEIKRLGRGDVRWFGHFRITESGDYFGLPLIRVWTAPKARIVRSSNLGLDFAAVTGRWPPPRFVSKPRSSLGLPRRRMRRNRALTGTMAMERGSRRLMT